MFIFGAFVIVLLAIAFGVTIYEFIEMDKHPEEYKNPRYKDRK